MAGSYRRDFWDQQPVRVQTWSEKGTVRGVLNKVLRKYAVDFQVMHGFSGATTVCGLAQDGDDGRPLVALYVGDYDPSGLFMSECDLPERLERYGGHHVRLESDRDRGKPTRRPPVISRGEQAKGPPL